jgi:hypothetical protein
MNRIKLVLVAALLATPAQIAASKAITSAAEPQQPDATMVIRRTVSPIRLFARPSLV